MTPFSNILQKQELLVPEAVTLMKALIQTLEKLKELVHEKGSDALYMEEYFPTLAKLCWPFLKEDIPDQLLTGRHATRGNHIFPAQSVGDSNKKSFHGYVMTTNLEEALLLDITNIEPILENLCVNIKQRFSNFTDNPIYSAVANLLDTKGYQFKDEADIKQSIPLLIEHFSTVLAANCCDTLKIQHEFDTVHLQVKTFLKNSSSHNVWPQLFQSRLDLAIDNILHLAEIAIVVPISSAEVERVFSKFVKILTKDRQSLKNQSVRGVLNSCF
ncbi:hypothetical protein SNE40_019847 [Patella caerulea]|uniref:HAT C-terminal dimerisation domain-containing protein n=1 Tax=Patella caerulea TaxID=87958 RepID=A0AAN8G9W8_PATCE